MRSNCLGAIDLFPPVYEIVERHRYSALEENRLLVECKLSIINDS